MVVFNKEQFTKKITVKHTDSSIFDYGQLNFQNYSLCVYGGRLALSPLVKKYCKDVEYVCFVYKWDNVIVNTDDIVVY